VYQGFFNEQASEAMTDENYRSLQGVKMVAVSR